MVGLILVHNIGRGYFLPSFSIYVYTVRRNGFNVCGPVDVAFRSLVLYLISYVIEFVLIY